MRTIWLQKPNTQEIWDLLPKNAWNKDHASPFLDIKGMGYRQEVTQTQVNTEYFVSKVLTKNQAITGTMYFQDDDHIKAFQEFVGDFRNQLHLYYSPSGEYEAGDQISAPYYKKVIITIADKTEKDETGWYLVAMTLSTQDDVWNRDRYYAVEELSNVGNALVYPYTYTYVLGGRNTLAVDLNNDGREVGCKVFIKNRIIYKAKTTSTTLTNVSVVDKDFAQKYGYGIIEKIFTYNGIDWQTKRNGVDKNVVLEDIGVSYQGTPIKDDTIIVFMNSNLTNIEWFLDRTYVDYYGILHDKVEVQRSKWNLDLSAGSELVVDSNPLTQEAKVIYPNGEAQSVVDAQEPSWEYINFIQVPTGQCRIVFYIENEDIDIKFIYREQKELI